MHQITIIFSHQEFLHSSTFKNVNSSCGEVWTEYDEISKESIRTVAEKKVYTAKSLLDLLRFVAPKMMQRAETHFSHGIAENLDDPKYAHFKYWSNPLETKQVQTLFSPFLQITLAKFSGNVNNCLSSIRT